MKKWTKIAITIAIVLILVTINTIRKMFFDYSDDGYQVITIVYVLGCALLPWIWLKRGGKEAVPNETTNDSMKNRIN